MLRATLRRDVEHSPIDATEFAEFHPLRRIAKYGTIRARELYNQQPATRVQASGADEEIEGEPT